VRRDIVPAPTWKNPCNAQRVQAFFTVESESCKDALMIANRGLCEYEVLRDGHNTLAVTLLRCIGEIGDWGIFPTPLGQKKGTYTLEYSMIPYETDRQAEAFGLGYVFAGNAVLAIGTDKHTGKLVPTADYIRSDNEYIRMSAFKKAEDQASVILRLFNTNTCEETLTLDLTPAFHEAWLTDLGEERSQALTLSENQLRLIVPAKKILTLELL